MPEVIKCSSGTIGIFHGESPKKYSLTFPGYTGDAYLHQGFIKKANSHNIGVIAVNIRYSNSVDQMIEASSSLLLQLTQNKFNLENIEFIRAVSFGAFISLPWLEKLTKIKKIAFITPCSGDHLVEVSQNMGMKVMYESNTIFTPQSDNQVKIIALETDRIVPETDSIFTDISKNTEIIEIPGSDHFIAGEFEECSEGIADWFAT